MYIVNETKEQFVARMQRDGVVDVIDGVIYGGVQQYALEVITVETLRDTPRHERKVFIDGEICRVTTMMRYQEPDTLCISYRHSDNSGYSMVKYLHNYVLVPTIRNFI